jgi:tRNA(adenine34) deaminase
MHAGAAAIEMGCREIFAAAPENFEVIGPALSVEAMKPHEEFWQRRSP